MKANTRRLIADIGGTNARFALLTNGEIGDEKELLCADYPDLVTAVETYLNEAGSDQAPLRPREAAIAIAGPLTGDIVRMTNSPWQFSLMRTRRALGFERLLLLNDFTALAMAIPLLPAEQLEQVGGSIGMPDAPIALLGAGTGLGVSGLVRCDRRWVPLQGEGGHVTLAATNDREHALLTYLRHRYGHVSAERVLSGPGIVNLHEAVCAVDPRGARAALTAEEITRRGLAGESPECVETLVLFCAFLGSVAGNLALTLGAAGGVYIGGGIVPKLGAFFAASPFRERFVAKGRYDEYLAPIPTYVIRAARPAFIGLAAAFDEPGPRLEAE